MESIKAAERHFADRELNLAVGDYTKAIEALGNLEEVTSNKRDLLAKAYNDRGQAEYQLVNFFKAISDFTSAININPEFWIAFYNRGLIHYRLGQYTLAIKDFETAIKFQPGFRDAMLARETALKEQQLNGDRYWPGYCEQI